jgi:ABC-type sugar transport system substrate-binding protein
VPPASNAFWEKVILAMRAAAEDLEIELIVKCSERGSLATKRAGTDLLNTKPRLDFLLTGYWPLVTRAHIELADELKIKVFIFNSEIIEEEREFFDRPRQKFKHWIGHMVPDEKKSSMELTRLLVERARVVKNLKNDDKIRVLGQFGTGTSQVGRSRTGGVRAQIGLMPNVQLQEIAMENWYTDWIRKSVVQALKENPDIDIIWNGSQSSALGALQGVEDAGKIPGKDVLVGGYDWNPELLQALSDGRLSLSMTGHFMEGVWALILAHDYHHGLDFAGDTGVRILTPLVAMTPENYEQFKVFFDGKALEKIDFRRFSKKYNPELKSYNFHVEQLLK